MDRTRDLKICNLSLVPLSYWPVCLARWQNLCFTSGALSSLIVYSKLGLCMYQVYMAHLVVYVGFAYHIGLYMAQRLRQFLIWSHYGWPVCRLHFHVDIMLEFHLYYGYIYLAAQGTSLGKLISTILMSLTAMFVQKASTPQAIPWKAYSRRKYTICHHYHAIRYICNPYAKAGPSAYPAWYRKETGTLRIGGLMEGMILIVFPVAQIPSWVTLSTSVQGLPMPTIMYTTSDTNTRSTMQPET